MHDVLAFLWQTLKKVISWYVRMLLFGIPTFFAVFLSLRAVEWLVGEGYMRAVNPQTIVTIISYALLALNAFVLVCRPKSVGFGYWSAWADKFFARTKQSNEPRP